MTRGTLGALLLLAVPAPAQDDIILRAMRDEIGRARLLKLADQDVPYYLQYALDDATSFAVTATLGALVQSRESRLRIPRVAVRVGSYEFDNTNYMFSSLFAPNPMASRLSLDDNYEAIRTQYWLLTDQAFKGSLQAIARKRAALRNVTVTEKLNDFARSHPLKQSWPHAAMVLERPTWTMRVQRLSAIFARFPEVLNSSVEFDASASDYYMADSEGTEIRVPETLVTLRVRASGQAPDGMPIRDSFIFQALRPEKMPTDAELERGVTQIAENVRALMAAPAGESYSGPVLFEGIAAAQLFAEVLGSNLAPVRRPVPEPGRNPTSQPSELEGRIGSRVLPEWMDVVDDPTQREWRGRELNGFYPVDMEGVVPQPLDLIQQGTLRNFLLTRQPVRGHEGSNGRARLPGNFGANLAVFSNLFVRASQTVTAQQLKARLLELAGARGRQYGFLVRRMDFPSQASLDELRRLTAGVQGGSRPVSLPLLLFRVHPDGREELVRGLRFRGLNVRSLRDIVAASDESHVFDFLANGAAFAAVGAASFVTPCTVVAPSVLLEDAELERPQEELPRLPLVPPPALEP